MLGGRHAEEVAEMKAEVRNINGHITVICVPVDITDTAAVDTLFERVKSVFGTADSLVNNAGVDGSGWPLRDADPHKWWKTFVGFPFS